MRPHFARWMAAGMLLAAVAGSARAARDVLTFHYDQERTGWNSVETTLRPDNVSSDSFGKIWYAPLDGQVYGAPLVVTDIAVAGATREVVYAATENNTVYALDPATGKVLWLNHLAPALTQTQFEQTIGVGSCPNINPIHGITGTPVIDRASNTLYACTLTLVSNQQTYELFAVNIATGKTKPGWPIALEGKDRTLTFRGSQNTQRGSLTLLNGTVYIPFSSRCDIGEWHGWVIGVPVAATHTPLQFFTTCLNAWGAGIWGSGGPTADAAGHLYIVTGNGDFNLNRNGNDFGQTIARLSISSSGISFSKQPDDYYTPSNYLEQNQQDQDLGGSSAIVLPDHVGSQTPHLLVTGGKDGILYLVNRDQMGGVGGEIEKAPLFAPGDFSVVRTTPACFIADDGNYFIYAAPEVYGSLSSPGAIRGVAAYRLIVAPNTHRSHMAFAWTNKARFLFPGTPAVSSDGGRNGILWDIDTGKTYQHTDTGGPGSLHAFDALTGRELYSSARLARDGLGEARKFSSPTIANGRVFLAGGGLNPKTNGVAAYGLFSNPGDLDDDGSVDIRDAEIALESVVGLLKLTAGQSKVADMNGDGVVDLKDVQLILRKAVGL